MCAEENISHTRQMCVISLGFMTFFLLRKRIFVQIENTIFYSYIVSFYPLFYCLIACISRFALTYIAGSSGKLEARLARKGYKIDEEEKKWICTGGGEEKRNVLSF